MRPGETKIVHKLQRMMITPNLTSQDSSIEGLAYASSTPHVKEELVKDRPFLKALILRLKNEDGPDPRSSRSNSTITVGKTLCQSSASTQQCDADIG